VPVVERSSSFGIRAIAAFHGAFEPIVDRQLFDGAQAIIGERSYRMPDEDMIAALRTLYERQGYWAFTASFSPAIAPAVCRTGPNFTSRTREGGENLGGRPARPFVAGKSSCVSHSTLSPREKRPRGSAIDR
jgi:hypothetical protein